MEVVAVHAHVREDLEGEQVVSGVGCVGMMGDASVSSTINTRIRIMDI